MATGGQGRVGDGDPRVHVETVEEWADWLAAHHADATGAWLVTWRTPTGRPAPTYDEAVTEALRFGWVDSVARRLDDERSMLRFSPRKRGSGWSRPNKVRIARLEADGRMAPAGAAVLAAAQADGSWTLLDAVEDLEVPDDLAAAFDAHPGSRERWEAFPRSAKRAILEWIVQAKRAETRARRVAETAEKAAPGERANQWTPKA
ncbi:YdeI family protein [Egicoccus sp. AB-alg2]|uniref:YdeI/OmpD-associated family protein n=1 Tax=Egicoccus sp. AB-alg2 TaxID=3242693 RepID=UPI00359D2A19